MNVDAGRAPAVLTDHQRSSFKLVFRLEGQGIHGHLLKGALNAGDQSVGLLGIKGDQDVSNPACSRVGSRASCTSMGRRRPKRLDDHHSAFAARGTKIGCGLPLDRLFWRGERLGRCIDAEQRAAQRQLLLAYAVSKKAVVPDAHKVQRQHVQ